MRSITLGNIDVDVLVVDGETRGFWTGTKTYSSFTDLFASSMLMKVMKPKQLEGRDGEKGRTVNGLEGRE